jgi:hypothetical protein
MRELVVFSGALMCVACGESPPPPVQNADARVQVRDDWPIAGDIVRDSSPPHPFHASLTLRYPELTAGLAEPAWDSPDAPSGTLSVWFHLGTADLPSGTTLKVAAWDDDPLHHCPHERVETPFIEVRYVESVRATRVFPATEGPTTVAGQMVLNAPSSSTAGAAGQLDVTLSDAKGHARRIKAKVRFDAPKELWTDQYGTCPKS